MDTISAYCLTTDSPLPGPYVDLDHPRKHCPSSCSFNCLLFLTLPETNKSRRRNWTHLIHMVLPGPSPGPPTSVAGWTDTRKVLRYPAITNDTFSCFIGICTLCNSVAACLCAASLCFLTACSQSGCGFTVTDSHRAERERRVGSLGHYGLKTSFKDGLCGVRGLALTVGNVSEIFPYFTLCVRFFNKPRTVGRSTHATLSWQTCKLVQRVQRAAG